MTENNVYTGSTPSIPSDGGVTPYPAVTTPISMNLSEKPVTTTPEVLFTAECAGITDFQFTDVKVTGGTVTFSLYINGSQANSKAVSPSNGSVNFTLSGCTGTNVCMISGTTGATVSGKIVQN